MYLPAAAATLPACADMLTIEPATLLLSFTITSELLVNPFTAASTKAVAAAASPNLINPEPAFIIASNDPFPSAFSFLNISAALDISPVI